MPAHKRGCRWETREVRENQASTQDLGGIQLAFSIDFPQDDNAELEPMIRIEAEQSRVSFAVKVHPRAKKNAITGELGDALKLSLTTPPIEGRANQACIDFFAKLLKVPRSSVTIASGQSGRNKVIRVAGVNREYVMERLRT